MEHGVGWQPSRPRHVRPLAYPGDGSRARDVHVTIEDPTGRRYREGNRTARRTRRTSSRSSRREGPGGRIGGVGAAFAPIAARRDFYEPITFADYDEGRARSVVDRYDGGSGRFGAAQVDASDAASVADLIRATGATHVLNAVDPRFVMPIFEGDVRGRRHVPRHGDVAVAARTPTSRTRRTGVKLGDEQFARRAGVGGARAARARGRRRGARALRRLRAVRRGPPVRRDRRGRRPRRREPGRQRVRLRAGLQHLDHDRGVPEPAGGVGARPRLVHAAAVQRARGVHVPRGHRAGRVRARRARGGAPDPALGRVPARHLQVRPRRRVHRGAEDAPQARAGPDRSGRREGPGGQPARRGGRMPARPGDARDRR